MSAIAMVSADNGIVVATDGAAYHPDGTLLFFDTKVLLAPEWSCVFAQRGAGGALRLVRYFLGDRSIFDLDGVLEHIPEATEAAFEEYGSRGYAYAPHFSIFIGGWSASRERFETHVVRTREMTAINAGTGLPEESVPFVPREIGGLIMAPAIQREGAARAGLDFDAVMSGQHGLGLDELCVRTVCATRFGRSEPEMEGETAECGTGGFVQLTILQRDHATTTIVHRWPDPLGEPIDPNRGEPAPEWAR